MNEKKIGKKFDRSHDVILEAAARLFSVKGYAAATLRDIAAAAGMQAGSLYYHFASKEEILDAILDQGVREIYNGVLAVIRANEHAGDFRPRIAAAIQAHLSLLLAQSDFTSANIRVFNQLPAEIRQRHQPLRLAYAEVWDGLLNEALAAGQLRDDVEIIPQRQFILGALNWTVEWADSDRQSPEQIGERYSQFILDGITPKSLDPNFMETLATVPPSAPAQAKATEPETKFERSHREILTAAAQLFRIRGYAATTLRDIAAAAGMKAGSLYYHFSSKDEMLDVILDRGVRQIYDGVAAVIQAPGSGEDYGARIAAAIHSHLSLILAQKEFTSANIRIFAQLPEEIRQRHRPLRMAYAELWQSLLAEAQNSGQLHAEIGIEPLRQFILDALNWTVEWFDPEQHRLEVVTVRCTKLILHGISAPMDPARQTINAR